LTFDVRVLEGDLASADGPVSVFVDIVGLPFTPLSVAGVAAARHGARIGTARLQLQVPRLRIIRDMDTRRLIIPILILTHTEAG
jgi:hypothetical protein